MKKLLYHPLFSGSLLMIGGNLIANFINYIYQVIMSKQLGIIGYGELSSVFAIFYIMTIIPSSASPSIVKFISSSKTHHEASLIYKRINSLILKVGLILSLSILILSPLLANFLRISLNEVALVAPVVLFSLLTIPNQALLQGLLHFWGNVGPNVIASASKLIFGLIFVIIGWRVFGAVFGVLFGSSIGYIYSLYLAKKFLNKYNPKGKFDFKIFLKYSIPVLIFSFAFTSFFTMDLILVKHFFSEIDAGIYATLSILGKIIFFAASPIANVMFPLVAGRHSKGQKYFKLLIMSLLITITISLGIVAAYSIFPNFIIGVFSKGKNIIPPQYLVWMGLFICFYTISFFMVNFFLSIDEVKIVFLPLAFAILQILLIWIFHTSLLLVIQISLSLMAVLFVILLSYLVYNRLKYEKKEA